MVQNQIFSKVVSDLKPGMIVDANGEIAVIVDVLRSQYTDQVCLFVRFPRNVGNARPYDILEVSPQRTLGVEQWQPATPAQLEERLAARQLWLEKEIDQLRQTAEVGVEV
jgi:hypothetical protein